MFGFFKKNNEQEKALAEKSQLELKTLADEIAALKEGLKDSQELSELKTADYEPRVQELVGENSRLNQQLGELQGQIKTLLAQNQSLNIELDRSRIQMPSISNHEHSEEIKKQLTQVQLEKEVLQERFNSLEKDRAEIVDNRQLLWEEYQKLDALRSSFDPSLGDRVNQLQVEKDE
jgi:predicted nuclease with TOPRIM domain